MSRFQGKKVKKRVELTRFVAEGRPREETVEAINTEIAAAGAEVPPPEVR